MSDLIYVARQSIYDRTFNVSAYELLYRSGDKNQADIEDHGLATAELLNNVFTAIGFDDLVGDKRAFINMPREFLVGSYPMPDLHKNVVIEILEHVEPEDIVIKKLLALKAKGHMLALDDYIFEEHLTPFIEIADIVKIDVKALGLKVLRERITELEKYDVILLAEKVETKEEADACLEMGFDLFQGYYFSRPKIISAKKNKRQADLGC